MPDNYQIENNKQSVSHSVFKVPDIIALCEEFYGLSREDDSYAETIEKLKSLSSYSEKDLLDCKETLSHEFPVFCNLIDYISISQHYYKNLCLKDNSFALSINETICITAYGKYARHILELLENDYASCSIHDRMLSVWYPPCKINFCFLIKN